MIDFSKIQEITLGGKVVVSITDADGLALWNADKTDGVIRGTFNVTNATASYPVVWRNYSAYEYALVDGEKIESPQTARTWTVGEHKVELKIKDGATNFSYMFYTLPYTSIDFSTAGLNKAGKYNFTSAFQSCKSLVTLDLTAVDFSQATVMPSFYYMQKLKTLKLNSTYGVGMKVATSNSGGWLNNCQVLTDLDVSNWDVSNMTSLANTFYCCYALKSLDVSNWNTSNVTSLSNMFSYCQAITSLDLSKWDTSKVTSFKDIFNHCSKLQSVDISGWNTKSATDVARMFYFTGSLTNIIFGENFGNWPDSGNEFVLSTCGYQTYQLTDATYESMLNMYDRAANGLSALNICFSSKHNIPDGFIDKMTAKGYTIIKE